MAHVREVLVHRLKAVPTSTRLAVGLAVLLLPLGVFASEETAPERTTRGLDGWSLALLVLAALILVGNRRRPATSVAAMTALASTWYWMGHSNGLINPFILVTFYRLGRTGDRRRQLGVGLPAVLFPVVGSLFQGSSVGTEYVDAIGWPIVAVLMGEMVLNRQQLLDEYERRAETAEAERDAEAERRVAEERLRIARDVHDVLAHTVAVMHVQAGAAADTLDRDPEASRRSLANIRSAGKEAMNEVRATVAVLREGAQDTEPAPGLDQIEGLVEATRRSGLAVRLYRDAPRTERTGRTEDADGDASGNTSASPDKAAPDSAAPDSAAPDSAAPDSAAPDSLTELTAYRIVQEALTNVRRHAVDPTSVDVTVVQLTGNLIIDVTDDGRTTTGSRLPGGRPPTDSAPVGPAGGHDERRGFGLRGMRERVEPLGGTLDSGPRPEGGWQVRASLPLRKAGP